MEKCFSCVLMGWDITDDVLERMEIEREQTKKDVEDFDIIESLLGGFFIGKAVSWVDDWNDIGLLAFDTLLLTELRQMAYRRIELLKDSWGLVVDEEPRLFHIFAQESEC